MALQSACIPIPSEVIMPLAGFALAHRQVELLLLATVGAIAGQRGVNPRVLGRRVGRTADGRALRRVRAAERRDLDRVDNFFVKYGSLAVLIGRMLPIVRTFIALPAGVAKMNQVRFHVYTFLGGWPWCYALAWVGMKLGDSFRTDPRFEAVFHRFHLAVELVLVAGIVWFVVSHWKNRIRAGEPA